MRSLLTLVAAVFLLSLLAPLAQAAPTDVALGLQMHWSWIAVLDESPWCDDPPRKGANDPIERLAPIHLDEHPWIGPPGKGANDPIERLAPIRLDDHPWSTDPPRKGANDPIDRLAPIHLDEWPWAEDPSKKGANKPQT